MALESFVELLQKGEMKSKKERERGGIRKTACFFGEIGDTRWLAFIVEACRIIPKRVESLFSFNLLHCLEVEQYIRRSFKSNKHDELQS